MGIGLIIIRQVLDLLIVLHLVGSLETAPALQLREVIFVGKLDVVRQVLRKKRRKFSLKYLKNKNKKN
jgi:hypothetical protein